MGRNMLQKKTFIGRTLLCPSCGETIRYSWLSGMSGSHIHLYATENNDVVMREAWVIRINELMLQSVTDSEVIEEIGNLLDVISPSLSEKYAVWNNVKCPKCRVEFPYRWKGNLKLRLEDRQVVLIDGCTLDSDNGICIVDISLPA